MYKHIRLQIPSTSRDWRPRHSVVEVWHEDRTSRERRASSWITSTAQPYSNRTPCTSQTTEPTSRREYMAAAAKDKASTPISPISSTGEIHSFETTTTCRAWCRDKTILRSSSWRPTKRSYGRKCSLLRGEELIHEPRQHRTAVIIETSTTS